MIAEGKTSFTWTNVAEGKHTVYAVGYDSNNKEYSTAKIPGKIEAEEFDFGGEGNAYHDNGEENRNKGDRNYCSPQTSSAISFTNFSFAHCSSSVNLLPISQEAKPHCGLR